VQGAALLLLGRLQVELAACPRRSRHRLLRRRTSRIRRLRRRPRLRPRRLPPGPRPLEGWAHRPPVFERRAGASPARERGQRSKVKNRRLWPRTAASKASSSALSAMPVSAAPLLPFSSSAASLSSMAAVVDGPQSVPPPRSGGRASVPPPPDLPWFSSSEQRVLRMCIFV
jgi:hypothetical protein